MTNIPEMIDTLRAAFGRIDRLDPGGAAYGRLCSILDRASDEALQAAADANIKFVSVLAQNRIAKRRFAAARRG